MIKFIIILFLIVKFMISGYSASKRRHTNKFLDLDMIMDIPKVFDTRNSYNEQIRSSMNRRQQSNNKSRYLQQNKQNCINAQHRLDRYDGPSQSPIRKTYISPIKQSYQRTKNHKSIVKQGAKNMGQINYQHEQQQNKIINYGYGQNKQNTYNYNSNKYESYKKNYPLPTALPLTKRSSIHYQSQIETSMIEDMQQPYSARTHYQVQSQINNFTVTFASKNNISLGVTTTPKKNQIQTEQLLQKTQFLRQRMQRINRMTPKGTNLKIEKSQQITPQKIIERQYLAKQSPYIIPISTSTSKQLFANNIVKYNKYCDEKLPLQTIYDAEQHKLELKSRQPTEQAEVYGQTQNGIQQINSLSKKISQKLRQIINRHSN